LHVASLVPLLSPPSGETWQAKLKHPEYLRPERGALEGKLGCLVTTVRVALLHQYESGSAESCVVYGRCGRGLAT